MKKLTHKEARKRQEAMRQYCAEGHTAKEVADKFGISPDWAKKVCRGIPLESRSINILLDRKANAIRYINERTPWFEYAGNFTGLDGFVDLKCKTCETVITKSFVSVKHGVARCNVCYQRDIDERRKKKKAEQEAQAKKDRQTRKFKRLFKMGIEQSTFKQCPICNTLFIGGRTYCSEKCRHQNKWHMKDGYRLQFPLDEIYKRDKGICYLCGEPCDWNDYEEKDGIIVYGNKYPSRDHVIPKSKGGRNTWENIRLAHRICNSLKSDSPSVQKMA